jgi:hypothetical protein
MRGRGGVVVGEQPLGPLRLRDREFAQPVLRRERLDQAQRRVALPPRAERAGRLVDALDQPAGLVRGELLRAGLRQHRERQVEHLRPVVQLRERLARDRELVVELGELAGVERGGPQPAAEHGHRAVELLPVLAQRAVEGDEVAAGEAEHELDRVAGHLHRVDGRLRLQFDGTAEVIEGPLAVLLGEGEEHDDLVAAIDGHGELPVPGEAAGGRLRLVGGARRGGRARRK